jgi:pseudaminic acid cytidylyltransferase
VVAQLRLRLDDIEQELTTSVQSFQRAATARPERRANASSRHWTTRSQDLEVAFHDASQFHWDARSVGIGPAGAFRESTAVVLPRWRVQDIDTQDDWRRAELMLAAVAV